MEDKHNHKFEDFILDTSFREYVEASKESSVDYWVKWIAEHPEDNDEISKAREILITLLHYNKESIFIDKHESLKELLSDIEKQDSKLYRIGPGKRFLGSVWARAAAVIFLSVGLTFIWQALTHKIVIETSLATNEIIVPVGEKSQIILSDGTHVWINSGSRFTYPVDFGENSRAVSLVGEAYFDVKKKGKSTFVVNTQDATIQVLGTMFNVKAYPEDKKTQTTVVKGLVRVESKIDGIEPVFIRPNEMAVVKKPETAQDQPDTTPGLNVIQQVNTTAITSWKDQMLVFADETFEDIAIKMERWFNTKIIIEDEKIKSERYTGKFVHNETVYEVLKAIQLTTPIEYAVKNDEIIITKK